MVALCEVAANTLKIDRPEVRAQAELLGDCLVFHRAGPVEMFNLSPESRAIERQLQFFYEQVLARMGITPFVQPDSPVLLFPFGGAHYGLSLTHSSYLQLTIRYIGLKDVTHLIENSFSGEVDPNPFIETANQLNALFGDIKIHIGTRDDVFFDASSYLFASPVPARVADVDLPLFELDACQSILSEKLIQLKYATSEFFGRVGCRFSGSDQDPSLPPSHRPANGEGVDFFPHALADAGHPRLNVGSERIPQFFAGVHGWTFFLKTNPEAPWHYSAAIPSVERQRFRRGKTLFNVFTGTLNHEFLDRANAFNGQIAGVKSHVFLDSGLAFLTMTGTVPFLERRHVARQIPIVWGTLLDGAKKLFGRAGYEIFSYASESSRRQHIHSEERGFEWIYKESVNAFEEEVGRTLAERVKGMYGKVLTGFHITTAEGDADLDTVAICEAGVFVIECKNYSGKISGNRNNRWKAKGDISSRTVAATRGKNPADQALGIAYALLKYLKAKAPAENPFIFAVVVVPDNAELDITDVTTNQFSDNAPVVFQLSALASAFQSGLPTRDNRRLTSQSIDLLALAITDSYQYSAFQSADKKT
jgi:Nuclease-related domain